MSLLPSDVTGAMQFEKANYLQAVKNALSKGFDRPSAGSRAQMMPHELHRTLCDGFCKTTQNTMPGNCEPFSCVLVTHTKFAVVDASPVAPSAKP
jgi:hypothetical protein